MSEVVWAVALRVAHHLLLLACVALPGVGCAGMRLQSATDRVTITEDLAYVPDDEPQARLSPSTDVRADAPLLLAFAAHRDYPFVLSVAAFVHDVVR